MKEAFNYYDESENLVNLFDVEKFLEFEINILGKKPVISAVRATTLTDLHMSKTAYQTYLEAQGMTTTQAAAVITRITAAPQLRLGITADSNIYVGTETARAAVFAEPITTISSLDMHSALTSVGLEIDRQKLNIVGAPNTNMWADGGGYFFYSTTSGDAQEIASQIAKKLGGELVTTTEDPDYSLRYATITVGVANGTVLFTEPNNFSNYDRLSFTAKGLPMNIRTVAYVGRSSVSSMHLIYVTADTLGPIAANNTGTINMNVGLGTADRIKTIRTDIINTLNGEGTLPALVAMEVFGGAETAATIITAYAGAPLGTSGFILDLAGDLRLPCMPPFISDMGFVIPLSEFQPTFRGESVRVTVSPASLAFSLHSSSLLKIYADMNTEESIAAAAIMTANPGIVRAVAYDEPIVMPHDIIHQLESYLDYSSICEEAGEPNEWMTKAVTTDGLTTWQDIENNCNKVATVSVSCLKSTALPSDVPVSTIVGTVTDAYTEYRIELRASLILGVPKYLMYAAINNGTAESVDLELIEFERIYTQTNGLIELIAAPDSQVSLNDILTAEYGSLNPGDIIATMNVGPFDSNTEEKYDFNWGYVFPSGWPNLKQTTREDTMLRGLALTEGLDVRTFKSFMTTLLLLAPSDELFEIVPVV